MSQKHQKLLLLLLSFHQFPQTLQNLIPFSNLLIFAALFSLPLTASCLLVSHLLWSFFLLFLLVLHSALSFPLLCAVEAFEEVSDSLCVPQYNADGEERVILFLKMAPGKPFCPELVAKIKGAIRKALSARHVPALLLETRDIPVRKL